ncbi:MAG: hypothetical protein II453_07055 [Alphaproteobacteria bacterium]|nr:hypothetical protein [Alphaproteobacteria bacterium]
MLFYSKIKYYVYVPNEIYGCFVVKAIFNNRQLAEDYASERNGFVDEVSERLQED